MHLTLRSIAIFSVSLVLPIAVTAQPSPAADAKAVEAAKTEKLPELLTLRDAFVKETAASGLPCAVDPPKLVLEDVPSFGSYDPETNTLRTGVWEILNPEEKAIFFRLAGNGSTEAAARKEYETGAHHWVFIHELGHWWQACRKVNDGRKPYAFESEADRIAAAYWRLHDPTIAKHMYAVFSGLVDHAPSPVPAGQEPAKYFNDNYEQLGPTPAYIWFQSKMCVTAFAEKPAPTFLQTLQETGKP
jgi:hypothetical protein